MSHYQPIVAIVGRPNVGKSTLFNRLTHTRDALVAEEAGLTRDRKYANITLHDKPFRLIDTGGVTYDENVIDKGILSQVEFALKETDIIYFLVSSKDGLTHMDRKISEHLRKLEKTLLLVVNKSEGLKEQDGFDFYELGIGEPILISAEHNQGLEDLAQRSVDHWNDEHSQNDEFEEIEETVGIAVSVLGRPNVGKSTLINRILGEERLLASEIAGTTRDSIDIEFQREGEIYTFIDTAGVRRKRSVSEKIEKFSIIKAIEALDRANIVLLVLDAQEGVTEQDATLLGMIVDRKRSLLILVNKWDGLDTYQKEEVKRKLDIKLSFIRYASVHFISALHGSGVGKLFKHIDNAYYEAQQRFSTSKLNKLLEQTVKHHQPPLVRGRRIRLKYINQIDTSPPTFLIHGNQAADTPKGYQLYLSNTFRKELELISTPIKLEFKSNSNPFEDNKNTLNQRQINKKRRLMKFVKKK
jgi:GTP-binding protein